MINIQIEIVEDEATPALERVSDFLTSPAANNLVGYEANRVVREHLQMLDETRPNKLGGERTHYYGDARKSTGFTVEGDGATVHIRQIGMALHYYGGTVNAGANSSATGGGTTKFLTIPADPEAHGKRASDFDLVLVWGRNGPWALALAERRDSFSTKDGVYRSIVTPGKIMFTLTPSVEIPSDPTVLPEPDIILSSVLDRLNKAIGRRWDGVGIEVGGVNLNDIPSSP